MILFTMYVVYDVIIHVYHHHHLCHLDHQRGANLPGNGEGVITTIRSISSDAFLPRLRTTCPSNS